MKGENIAIKSKTKGKDGESSRVMYKKNRACVGGGGRGGEGTRATLFTAGPYTLISPNPGLERGLTIK